MEHIAKGEPKVPVIIKSLGNLIELGFELNYVMMDREFYNAELLYKIKGLKGDVLIPAKAYKKITKIIEEYLNDTGKRVRKYTLSSASGKEFQFFQNVYLIIKVKKGHTLLSVKRVFQYRKLTQIEISRLEGHLIYL